ncbi:MAG: TlpA family protein disulfide reductase [Xanthomonadales bacterium]|nr:TlpA family protein disulfide reductase [Xanthomonadales bacterium]
MMIRILMGALVSGALCLGLAGHARAGGLEGKPAPSIQIESADGVAHSVAEVTKGRRSIVIFWASWCPFCKAVMTDLVAEKQALGQDVAMIAINVWDDDDEGDDITPEEVLRNRGLSDFESLRGDDADAKAWGVKGTPGLFVLDANGSVVWDLSAHSYERPQVSDRRAAAAHMSKLWVRDIKAALASP